MLALVGCRLLSNPRYSWHEPGTVYNTMKASWDCKQCNTEWLSAKFQWFTVLYGIKCSFGDNTRVRIVHQKASQDSISHSWPLGVLGKPPAPPKVTSAHLPPGQFPTPPLVNFPSRTLTPGHLPPVHFFPWSFPPNLSCPLVTSPPFHFSPFCQIQSYNNFFESKSWEGHVSLPLVLSMYLVDLFEHCSNHIWYPTVLLSNVLIWFKHNFFPNIMDQVRLKCDISLI